MFNNALQDQTLLDCLDLLDQVGAVDVDVPGAVTNDAPVTRAMLMEAAEMKLTLMIATANSNIKSRDPRVWSVKKTTQIDGSQLTSIRLKYDKSQVLCKLFRLITVQDRTAQ